MLETEEEKMRVIHEEPLDWEAIANWIEGLEELLAQRQEEAILAHMQILAPEYDTAAGTAPGRSSKPAPGVFAPTHARLLSSNGHGAGFLHEKNGNFKDQKNGNFKDH